VGHSILGGCILQIDRAAVTG